jgi:hypothetical protein
MKIMKDLIILIPTRWSRIYLEFQLCYFTSKSLFAALHRHIYISLMHSAFLNRNFPGTMRHNFKRQGVDLKWEVVNSVWEVVNSNWENDNSKWECDNSEWENDNSEWENNKSSWESK